MGGGAATEERFAASAGASLSLPRLAAGAMRGTACGGRQGPAARRPPPAAAEAMGARTGRATISTFGLHVPVRRRWGERLAWRRCVAVRDRGGANRAPADVVGCWDARRRRPGSNPAASRRIGLSMHLGRPAHGPSSSTGDGRHSADPGVRRAAGAEHEADPRGPAQFQGPRGPEPRHGEDHRTDRPDPLGKVDRPPGIEPAKVGPPGRQSRHTGGTKPRVWSLCRPSHPQGRKPRHRDRHRRPPEDSR